jgi:Zn-dependent M28 family amino/carboxypeptidase
MKKQLYFLILSLILNLFVFGQTTYTIQQNMKYLASTQLQGRNAGSKGDSLAQIYIIDNLKSIGVDPFFEDYLQPFTSKTEAIRGGETVSTKNIIGFIEGTDSVLKKEYIIICAHFDHVGLEKGRIHPGANDNASGVVTILNMAKMFKINPLKRSMLIVFFGAEEKGLLGSYYFVKNSPFSLKSIDAVFNFDMVGKLKQEGTLYSKGEQTAKEFPELLTKYSEKYKVKYDVSPFDYMNGSDHYPFYKKRIPVLFFNTGLDWDNYHQPSDLPEKIDFEGIESISKIAFDIITEVANKPEKLKFNKK